MPERKRVELYADGAAHGNPGRGGWAALLVFGPHRRELSGGFRRTTNNRMELMGVLVGLETLKEPCAVVVVSDSKYVVDAIDQGWARKWARNAWRRKGGDTAKNADLWARVLAQCDRHSVTTRWVRGHCGHPENERCDRLAGDAARGRDLPPDVVFELAGPDEPEPNQEPLFDVGGEHARPLWTQEGRP